MRFIWLRPISSIWWSCIRRCEEMEEISSLRLVLEAHIYGRYWIRTSDLFGVNEARYRCANRPNRPDNDARIIPLNRDWMHCCNIGIAREVARVQGENVGDSVNGHCG